MVILYSILFFVYSNFIVLQNLFLLTRNKNQRSKLNFSLIGLKYKFKSVLFFRRYHGACHISKLIVANHCLQTFLRVYDKVHGQ